MDELLQKCSELQNDGDRDKLSETRQTILKNHLPDKNFYVLWSESIVNEDVAALQSYLDCVLKNYPDFELLSRGLHIAMAWNEQEILNNEELQAIFENLLKVGGVDLFSGIEFWRKYKDFLIEEYEDYLDQIQEKAKQEGSTAIDAKALKNAKQKFIKLFHRQLSVPLVGNDQTLQQLDSVLSDYCVESDVDIIQPQALQAKFRASEKLKESRLTYELFLHSDEYQGLTIATDKWKAWKTYIAFEKEEKEMSRAQRLYERAVLACCFPTTNDSQVVREEVWLEYCEFVVCQLRNVAFGMSSLLSRALKHCPHSLWLRKCALYLLSASLASEFASNLAIVLSWAEEFLQAGDESSNNNSNNGFFLLRSAYAEAMQTGFVSANSSDDYLQYQLAHCNLYRRLLHQCFGNATVGSIGYNQCFVVSLLPNDANLAGKKVVLQALLQEYKHSLEKYETLLKTYYADYLMGWYEYVKYVHRVQSFIILPIQLYLDTTAQLSDNDTNTTAVPAFGNQRTVNNNKKQPITPQKQLVLSLSKQWEEIIQSFAASQGCYYWLWKEMVTSFLQQGEVDIVRSVYKKLLAHYHFLDADKSVVLKDFVRFEEDYSTELTTVYQMISKVLPHLIDQLHNSQNSTDTEPSAVTSTVYPAASSAKPQKRSLIATSTTRSEPNNNRLQQQTSQANQEFVADEGTEEPATKKKRVVFSSNLEEMKEIPSPVPVPVTTSTTSPQPEMTSNEANSTVTQINEANVKDRTFFIKNFPFNTPQEEVGTFVRDSLQGLDNIVIEYIPSKSGGFRGIVKVVLPVSCTAQDKDKVLAINDVQYKGRTMAVTVLTNETDFSLLKSNHATEATQQNIPTTTVFVNHLAEQVTDDDLRQLFASCGEIVAAKVARDKRSHVSKGNGLVEFATEKGKYKAIKLVHKTQFFGNEITVTSSKFAIIQPTTTALPPETSQSGETMQVDEAIVTSQDKKEVAEPHQEKTKKAASSAPLTTTMFKPRGLMKPKLQLK